MTKSKVRQTKAVERFVVSHELVGRWLLCQNIGKVFYHSEMPYDQLLEVKEFLMNSDFLKEAIFSKPFK
ncbi:MAG: hypothetical protein AAB456_04350 [Patescibacteria group bacterium]